jgi:flagellar motor switch protein FliN/FliY
MADDALSQDAIEALLAAESGGQDAPAEAAASDGPLSQDAIEALLAAESSVEPLEVAELVEDDAAASDGPLSQADIEALLSAEQTPAPAAAAASAEPEPIVEAIALDELHAIVAPIDERAQIELLLDVPLAITVELGQATVTIRELLELGQGSILPLDRRAGEPVDVLVNGQRLARGEVVVIDEDFGIRVTDVVSRTDRLRSMGE